MPPKEARKGNLAREVERARGVNSFLLGLLVHIAGHVVRKGIGALSVQIRHPDHLSHAKAQIWPKLR